MKKLTSDEVKHVAKLAKLELTDAEVEKLGNQLSETISYVDKLNEIDTSKTKPTNQVSGLKNRFRPDIVRPELVTPQKGYFKVKLILDKNK
jgi:aspartyl-tRNA(Asn)/glutamyl-tRNA(Gln) amidotransferase subunit C